jgi:putative transcriptional regulator
MKKNTTVVRLGADGKLRRLNTDGTLTVLKVKPIPGWPDDRIEAAAMSDPDNPPLTRAELAKMHRVPRVKRLRFSLGLSQEEFAKRYQIPLGTLRDWEQGRTEPDQAARAYLQVIAHNPENVRTALLAAKKPRRSRSKFVSS